jgi:hypothetical protein
MSRILIVQCGPNRGIWCRTEEHRVRLWSEMRFWPDDMKALAQTLPVRIADSAEGWAFLAGLVAGERKLDSLLKDLRKITAVLGPDEWPDISDYYNPWRPSEPSGLLPQFRTESDERGVAYFAADGAPAGGGSA